MHTPGQIHSGFAERAASHTARFLLEHGPAFHMALRFTCVSRSKWSVQIKLNLMTGIFDR
jgi:hypothetical protein